MICAVKLSKDGKIFAEDVIASNYHDAEYAALARNPDAIVVSVSVSHDSPIKQD